MPSAMGPTRNSASLPEAYRRRPLARAGSAWIGGTVLAVVFVPGLAGAGGLQTDFNWPLAAEYITNPGFQPDGTAIVRRVRSLPEGELAWNGEANRVYARAGALVERTDSQLLMRDRTAPRGTAGWNRQFARGNIGAELKYEEMAMRVGESQENGIAGTDGTRKTRAGSASLTYQITETTSMNAGAGAQNVRYARLALPGFDLYTTSARVSMGMSALTNVTIGVAAERRHPESPGGRQTELYSARTGLEKKAGERLTWSFDAGAYRQVPISKSGWLAHGAVDYRLLSGSAGLAYDRNATANTGLGVAVTDRVSANLWLALTELDGITLKLGRVETRTATLEKVTDASLHYARRVRPGFELGASYQWLRHTSAAGDADGQVIGVNMKYSDSCRW